MASFLILGPIEAWAGEQRLMLGGPQQLTLFAFLVLHANRAVSTDMLIDAVWGSVPPGAAKRLQMAITRLRRSLEPIGNAEPVLRTVHGGYLLAISSGELDADVFRARLHEGQQVLKAGDPVRAADLLRSALGLWRGQPLAEVAFDDFAQAEIRRLEELRLVALESRIDARLQLGEHGQLASDLEGLTIEYPLRERFAGQLMLALYRCGRQSDALDVYQRARTQLAQELGLEPGPLLKDLQRKILNQSPSLGATTSPDQTGADDLPPQTQSAHYGMPAALDAASRGAFVGRQTELDRLIRLWRRSSEGVRQAVLVAGEPGIGKTTLLAHFAAEVVTRHGLVLYGRCDEKLSVPYQPIVESFRTYLQHDARAVLASGPFSGELARILPELRQFELAQPMSAQERDTDTSRSLLFHSVVQVFRRLGELSPLLVLLEDLHWADPSTLELLRAILRAAEPANILLAATYRDDDPKRVEAVEGALMDPGHLVEVTHVQLAGLTEVDIRNLLAERSAERSDALVNAVTALHAYTLGNPLFVSQLVVDSDGGVPDPLRSPSGQSRSPNLSRELRVIVRRRIASLGSAVQDILITAVVLGSRWPLRLLQEVTHTSSAGDRLLDALDLAVSAGILTEEQPGLFAFTHELIRDALVAELPTVQRMRLHLAIADAIERAFVVDDMLGDLSFHLRMAAPLGYAAKAARYTLRSAAQEFQLAAFERARIHLSESLNALDIDRPSEPALKCELLLAIAGAAAAAGDNNGNRESCLRAAAIARAAQSWEHLGVAAVQAAAAGVFGTADSSVLDICCDAMQKADAMSPALRAQVIVVTAYYRSTFEGASCEHEDLTRQALEIARSTGSQGVFAFVGFLRFWTLYSLERVPEALALADELVDTSTTRAAGDAPTDERAATRASPYWGRSYGLRCRLAAALKRGARDSFDQDVNNIEELAGAPVSLVGHIAKMFRGTAALMDGDLPQVEHGLLELEPFLGSDQNLVSAYLAQLFQLRYEQGRISELRPFLSGALEANPGLRALRVALAFTAAEMGDAGQAQDLLGTERGGGFSRFPRNIAWMTSMALAAEVAAYLSDAAWSQELCDLMLPSKGTFVVVAYGVACRGAVDRFLGILEVTRGNVDIAVQHLMMAEQMEFRMRAPALVARTQYWLARALQLRAASGDTERAEALLDHARRTAQQLGLARLAADIATNGRLVSA